MKMSRLLRSSLWLLPAALVLSLAPRVIARAADTKTVFVSFLDEKGAPVTNLQEGDIALGEDGVVRDIVSAKLSTQPISLLLLADTTKVAGGGGVDQKKSAAAAGDMIHDIRAAFAALTAEVLGASPQSEISLMEFGQASITIQPYTSSLDALNKSFTKLVSKPDADSVLLEAITEGAKDLAKRKNIRRAMVSINVEPGNELSKEPPKTILNELLNARSPLFSVALQKGDLKNPTRGAAMPVLTKTTGGRYDFIVGQSALVDIVKLYGNIMLSQYEITYTRPPGPTPQRLMIGHTRPEKLQVLAPAAPPK